MDRDELRDFLTGLGIPPRVAQALHDEGFDGRPLVLALEEDSLAAGAAKAGLEGVLTASMIELLVKLRPKVEEQNAKVASEAAAAAATGARPKKKAPAATDGQGNASRRGPIKRQRERPFGKPANDSNGYTYGDYIRHESGASSLLEPAREFKRIDLSQMKEETSFIERIYEFAFGCLNARCNGTLYIGVADDHANAGIHGQIVGNFLTPNQMEHLQKILEENLTTLGAKYTCGLPDEEVSAIRSSIRPLQFVPVNKGVPQSVWDTAPENADLFVIELDVEPETAWCKKIKFKLDVRREGAKGNKKKMKNKESEALREYTYFIRDGTNSNSFKESDKAKMQQIDTAIDRRETQEKARGDSIKKTDKIIKIKTLLTLNRSSGFPNDCIRYVLLANNLEVDKEKLTWLKAIPWFVVLDFADNTTVFDIIRENSQIPSYRADELFQSYKATKSLGTYLQNIVGARRSLHVTCSPQVNQNWYQTIGRGLNMLIGAASNHDSDTMSNVLVITMLGSHVNVEFMAETLKKFGEVLPSEAHMTCFYGNPKVVRQLNREVDKLFEGRWKEQTEHVDFSSLNTFLLSLTGFKNWEEEYLIPGSSGFATITKKKLREFENDGLTILPKDVCDFIDKPNVKDIDGEITRLDEEILEYLKGLTPPPWILYYSAESVEKSGTIQSNLTKGLVLRDITEDIYNRLLDLERRPEGIVARLPISHMPSAGATTIARHVLWKLKDKRRVALIDGDSTKDQNLREIANTILRYRSFQEKAEVSRGDHADLQCQTVILLLDNCPPKMAQKLAIAVEEACERKGISPSKIIAIIISLHSTFDYKLRGINKDDKDLNAGDREYVMHIERKLSKEEANRFSYKLNEIKKKRNTVEDLLSFVILAYANEEDSSFVCKVVMKTIKDMDPRQKELLIFLSILKYYSNAKMPYKTALAYAYDGRDKKNSFSPQFESIVAFHFNATYGGSFWARDFLFIPHHSVAYQVLRVKALVPDGELGTKLKDFLMEKTIIEKSCLDFHSVIHRLLTDRSSNEAPSGKEDFSKVITEILEISDEKKSALDVLECAFEKLSTPFMKSRVAQTLARICMDSDATQEDSKNWAERAVNEAPNSFAIRDTLGQVFKTRLKHLTEQASRSNYIIASHPEVFEAWSSATKHFKKALEIYNSKKEGRHREREGGVASDMPQDEDEEDGVDQHSTTPFSIVEANIALLNFILKSEDLRDKQDRDEFIKILVEGEYTQVEDFTDLFSTSPEFSWDEYREEIIEIFRSTKSYLQGMTQRLCYEDVELTKHKVDWIRLGKSMSSFKKIFATPLQLLDVDMYLPENMANLRSTLQVGLVESFGWLSRTNHINVWEEETQLSHYEHCLTAMMMVYSDNVLLTKADKVLLTKADKASYINYEFAVLFKTISRPNCFTFDENSIKDFLRCLVSDDLDSMDPYFFFTLVFFPEISKKVDVEGPARLEFLEDWQNYDRCLGKLRDFKKLNFYLTSARVICYLGRGSDLRRFLPPTAPMGKRLRLSGRLDSEKKNVIVSCGDSAVDPQEMTVNLKNIKSNNQVEPNSNVKFHLAFTYQGPIATDVVPLIL